MRDPRWPHLVRRPVATSVEPVWFGWREVRAALAHASTGGIALHHFHWDLRRFGLGRNDPACHVLSADRDELIVFVGAFGLREAWIQPPRPHRPHVWHFDAFGPVLAWLEEAHPPPRGIDDRPQRPEPPERHADGRAQREGDGPR